MISTTRRQLSTTQTLSLKNWEDEEVFLFSYATAKNKNVSVKRLEEYFERVREIRRQSFISKEEKEELLIKIATGQLVKVHRSLNAIEEKLKRFTEDNALPIELQINENEGTDNLDVERGFKEEREELKEIINLEGINGSKEREGEMCNEMERKGGDKYMGSNRSRCELTRKSGIIPKKRREMIENIQGSMLKDFQKIPKLREGHTRENVVTGGERKGRISGEYLIHNEQEGRSGYVETKELSLFLPNSPSTILTQYLHQYIQLINTECQTFTPNLFTSNSSHTNINNIVEGNSNEQRQTTKIIGYLRDIRKTMAEIYKVFIKLFNK